MNHRAKYTVEKRAVSRDLEIAACSQAPTTWTYHERAQEAVDDARAYVTDHQDDALPQAFVHRRRAHGNSDTILVVLRTTDGEIREERP
jgi:hypothetical protein